jgi:hypothetical protein
LGLQGSEFLFGLKNQTNKKTWTISFTEMIQQKQVC